MPRSPLRPVDFLELPLQAPKPQARPDSLALRTCSPPRPRDRRCSAALQPNPKLPSRPEVSLAGPRMCSLSRLVEVAYSVLPTRLSNQPEEVYLVEELCRNPNRSKLIPAACLATLNPQTNLSKWEVASLVLSFSSRSNNRAPVSSTHLL
jgi:hypothetical protein